MERGSRGGERGYRGGEFDVALQIMGIRSQDLTRVVGVMLEEDIGK
jgi:hypothetical protein